VLAGNALAAIVWVNNFLYGAILLLLWWYLCAKRRNAARVAAVPFALMTALPPYPNWIFIDNVGAYHFVLGIETFTTSFGGLLALFLYFLVAYVGIYLAIGGGKQ
jgi:hypothetical protein